MTTQLIRLTIVSALAVAQVGPAVAQPTSPSQGGPQIWRPQPDLPQIQPPRPVRPIPVGVFPVPPPVIERPQIQPPIYPGRNFAGFVRCESFNNSWRQCNANTRGRVELVRTLSGTCQRGRNWGMTAGYVWVERGCRADFGYGYANLSNPYPVPQPQPVRDRGPSAGAVIAGVVVAGSLIALLASQNKSATPAASTPPEPQTFPAGPPATLSADLSSIPSAAQSAVQSCMFDAARQIGVTGGTRLRYERTTSLEQGNGGWRFRAAMVASYPNGDRALDMYCRATPTQVIQLDFS